MPQTKTRPDRLQEAHDRLTAAVESIVSGEDWQRMLTVASKFHRYSFNNQLMLFIQKPDATLVAGFNKWKSLNRSVRKGEKGLAIFAPCKYRIKPDAQATANAESPIASASASSDTSDNSKSMQLRGFKVVHVFDISQTDGEPIEDLEALRPKVLDGDAPKGIWEVLVAQATDAGFEVIRHQKGNENGYCDFLKKQIAVRPDVAPAQAVKTLVHELGHALLHGDDHHGDRDRQEVEVESVAYIVCDALRLDTSGYSFTYVARWSDGNTSLLRETAERVIKCSKDILKSLEVTMENREMEVAS